MRLTNQWKCIDPMGRWVNHINGANIYIDKTNTH